MEPDTRGVTALLGPEDPYVPVFESIFWQLCEDMTFDPAAPGPDTEEPRPWELPEDFDLDAEFPPDLRTMVSKLSGRLDVTGFLFEKQQLERFMAAMEEQHATDTPGPEPADQSDELHRSEDGVEDQAHSGETSGDDAGTAAGADPERFD